MITIYIYIYTHTHVCVCIYIYIYIYTSMSDLETSKRGGASKLPEAEPLSRSSPLKTDRTPNLKSSQDLSPAGPGPRRS